MTEVLWSDDLSVGVELIDDQHKALIKRLEEVARAVDESQGEREVVRTLTFLGEYAEFHFSAEEAHMEKIGYPGLEEQRVQHQSFLGTLAEMERDYKEEGSTRGLADGINTFLVNWLVKHIVGVDRKLGEYIVAKRNARDG